MIDALAAEGGLPLLEPRTLVVLGFLGVWTALDMTAFLQILVSQPLVAAWMGGWVAGDPATGLAVGLVMQGIWGRTLPLGSNPLPLVGPGALVAGALAAAAEGPRFDLGPVLTVPGALPLAAALMVGVGVAAAGGSVLSRIHRGRAGVLRAALASVERGQPEGVVRSNLRGMIPVAVLGLVATGTGLALGIAIHALLGGRPGGHGAWVALPVLGVGIGQTASLSGGRRVWVWSAGALILGLLAVAV